VGFAALWTLDTINNNWRHFKLQEQRRQRHLSASDSLRPWRYINLLTYLLTYLLTNNNNNSYYYFYYASSIIAIIIIMPGPTGWGITAVLCLSVCLSVCLCGCPVPDSLSQERNGVDNW